MGIELFSLQILPSFFDLFKLSLLYYIAGYIASGLLIFSIKKPRLIPGLKEFYLQSDFLIYTIS